MTEECPICREKIETDEQQIPCCHSFHYHCIYTALYFNKQSGIKLECPVCRKSAGCLPIKDDYQYTYGVHQLSNRNYCKKCCKVIKEGEFCNKHRYQNKCQYVFKRSKKSGETCNKPCEGEFCKAHINSTKNTSGVLITTYDWNKIINMAKQNTELFDIVNKYIDKNNL